MLGFVVRRLAATLVVLLVASFLVYVLTAMSGDPLADLRAAGTRDALVKLASLEERLNLDVPPALRYFLWLGGAAGCLIGRCDLGISIAQGEQPVIDALSTAMGSTLQLVTLATILSIIVGITIGMTTALRQYSGYDYTVTFFAFVFYSLPIFWVAVLLKEFGAIRFNQFLDDPVLSPLATILISLGLGLIIAGIVGGGLKTRSRVFGITLLLSLVVLTLSSLTQWLKSPSLGIVGVILLTAGLAFLITLLNRGLDDRKAVWTAVGVTALVAALWYPMQFLFFFVNNPLGIVAALLILGGLGFVVGTFFGGDDKREISRLGAIIGAASVLVLVLDQMLLRFEEYKAAISLKAGFISTIGAVTPALAKSDDMWLRMLDSFGHLILPTIALMIVSVAGYTRYSRASLLEVLNQDYIRTARAKGLPERTVIMRHAFRNAMIPIATIITFDIAGLIGGAIITERVFAWQGMGALFNKGLQAVDVNLVMGFFIVTGAIAVVFNIVADVLYSALDPRIRVN
jgi:peptide/nickel transport system permease protein